MQTLIIDAQNFLAGISTNDNIADAGYSPKSKGMNPLYDKGVLHFQPREFAITYAGTRVVVGIGNEADTNHEGLIVDSAGRFMYINSGAGSTTLVDTDTSQDYVRGQSDIIFFNGKAYITSDEDIIEWGVGVAAPNTLDLNYWTTSLSQAALSGQNKHPLEVVEDTMYIGDGNEIHTVDTAETAVTAAMTLPEGLEITRLTKHTNGRDLIAFCTQHNTFGNLKHVRNVAYIINTVSLEFSEEIKLDDTVTSARNIGGIIYVIYGTNLGYFTDSGIVFLRELKVEYSTESSLIYNNRMCDVSDMFLCVEDNQHSVLAIKDLGLGKSYFYPINETDSEVINCIFSIGEKKIVMCKDNALYTVNFTLDSSTSSSKLLYTNKYPLPARAWIRRVEVEHTPLSSGLGLKLYSVNESGDLTDLGTKDFTGSSTARFSRWDMNVFTSMAQVALQAIKTSGSNSIGIRKITIYYEIGDEV